MLDSFSCVPFDLEYFISKAAFIVAHSDVDVEHFQS